ncbi:FHA domain-containing protein [Xanthomonas sp. PPL568]|uniref:FHA domain-containing protein n=1 Tax=Xanthomonas indica TaxID=2912242 RepID=UPI001F58C330|nr:FHA domain-containing protein [Xanthomonas indica]MCI2246104.1 FHA domain-containing protein [Xanthomonas indica]
MHDLQLHFSNRQHPDRPLRAGVHRIVRLASGQVSVVDDTQGALLLAQFCLDRRGLWLQVANCSRGIHVNGRPVRRMALLRAGDAIYADGVEMVVQGKCEPLHRLPEVSEAEHDDPRLVLRGVGGPHHGRSFTVDRVRSIGRLRECDIRIDDPACAEQHARLERHGERVLLRGFGDAQTQVNGIAVRSCWLQPGDQVVFDAQHRFVLEVPQVVGAEPLRDDPALAALALTPAAVAPRPATARRWPWLLLSALLLAAALSGLLWFGAR